MKKTLIKYLKRVQNLQIAALGHNVFWVNTIEVDNRTSFGVTIFVDDTHINFYFYYYETEKKYKLTYDNLCETLRKQGYDL